MEECMKAASKFRGADTFKHVSESLDDLEKSMKNVDGMDVGMHFLLAQHILGRIREAVICTDNNQTRQTNWNGRLSDVIVKAAKWYLEYSGIYYPECESRPEKLFGQEEPPWDLRRPNQSTVKFFSEQHWMRDRFIPDMEHFIKSVVEIVDMFNIFADVKIKNIITWSWANPPGFLQEQCANFTEGSQKIKRAESTTVEIELNSTRFLTHAISVPKFLELLREATTRGSAGLKIVGRKSEIQYTHPALVWCAVALTEHECLQIPYTNAQDYFKGKTENLYGTVVLKFPFSAILEELSNFGYVLGTREYGDEYSQTILVPPIHSSPENHKCYLVEARGVKNLERVKLENYKWPLDFNCLGDWTHPELAFVDELTIPFEGLSLTFSDHSCGEWKRKYCGHCKTSRNTKTTSK